MRVVGGGGMVGGCVAVGLRWLWGYFGPMVLWLFPGCGGLVGCVQSSVLGAGAPRLPRFILLVSFSGTLLVVSILDIVYDCHLRLLFKS